MSFTFVERDVGGLERSINEERLPHHLANCKVQNKKCGGSVYGLFMAPQEKYGEMLV